VIRHRGLRANSRVTNGVSVTLPESNRGSARYRLRCMNKRIKSGLHIAVVNSAAEAAFNARNWKALRARGQKGSHTPKGDPLNRRGPAKGCALCAVVALRPA
jgi:hypothetical protein